jgi:pyruvate carboxylase
VTITLVRVSGLDGNGNRKLTFEVNGAKCTIVAKDAAEGNAVTAALADLDDPNQVPSPLPGTVRHVVLANRCCLPLLLTEFLFLTDILLPFTHL